MGRSRIVPRLFVTARSARALCVAVVAIGKGLERVAQRGARCDAELGEDPVEVTADRSGRQVEAFRDLFVGESGGCQPR